MSNLLPALSAEGWVGTSNTLVDTLFAHFLLAEYSQTHLHKGQITSLPWIIQQNTDLDQLQDTTTQELTRYYLRYFASVEVFVSVKPDSDTQNTHTMYIEVECVTDLGRVFTLSKAVTIDGSKVIKVALINN